MSDTMQELLELVEENKESMNSEAYLNLVNGLQELYKRTNGSYTTDYRQMYMDLQQEHKMAKEFMELADDRKFCNSYWVYNEGSAYGYEWFENKWHKKIVQRYWDGIGYQRHYYDQNGKLTRMSMLDKDFNLHCKDGPAVKCYDENGNVSAEEWFEHDFITRSKEYHPDGSIESESVYESSEPIEVVYIRNYKKNPIFGTFLFEEMWLVNDKLSRDENYPAYVKYNEKTGLKEYEEYYVDGDKVREKKYCSVEGPNCGKLMEERFDPKYWGFSEPDLISYDLETGNVRKRWVDEKGNRTYVRKYSPEGVLLEEHQGI